MDFDIDLPKVANIAELAYATSQTDTPSQHNKWYQHFLGFVTFCDESGVDKKRHDCFFGYKDLTDTRLVHIPLYSGYQITQVENEPIDIIKTCPWVLMMYGNDNTSYFWRLSTQEQVIDLIKHLPRNFTTLLDLVDEAVLPHLFYYNS